MSGTEIKTGREFDAETGLFYYRARYFSPDLGRFLARDPLGFSAGDANLFRYCGNNPVIHVDPSGLREVVVRIYYYFETVKVNDAIKQQVNRIFQDAVKTKGGKKHTLKVEWEEVADKTSFDAKPFGWVGGGWFHNCPDGVNLGMRDTLKMGQVPAQAGGFKANMNPTVIEESAQEAKVSFDIAVARVIAHELGLHGIATSGHYHDEGWIDADKGGQLTGKGVFSPEAAQAICDQLDIEEGD